MPQHEFLFLQEELLFRPKNTWTKDINLLREQGLFFLKDVAAELGFSSQRMQAFLRRYAKGRSVNEIYPETGIRKCCKTYYIRMSVFSRFYQFTYSRYCPRIPEGATLDQLKDSEQPVLLVDLARLVPEQADWWLRYYGKTDPESGIFKDSTGHWLCKPKDFVPWLESKTSQPTLADLRRVG